MDKKIGFTDYAPLLKQFVALAQATVGDDLISVVLYGSVARGEASPMSDIDLLLVVRNSSPAYHERISPLLPILRQLRHQDVGQDTLTGQIGPEINVLVLSPEEADQNRLLYLDMIADAHILVDRGGFFRNRLKKLQRRLHELDATKVTRNGSWYWDLSPLLQPEESVVL